MATVRVPDGVAPGGQFMLQAPGGRLANVNSVPPLPPTTRAPPCKADDSLPFPTFMSTRAVPPPFRETHCLSASPLEAAARAS